MWSPDSYQWDPYALRAVKQEAPGWQTAPGSSKPARHDAKGAKKASTEHSSQQGADAGGLTKRRPALCQVAGCRQELSELKNYYKRYHICEEHFSMSVMLVDGKESRFCQACGRFHGIEEFEGSKKSCRAKLQRHNERRSAKKRAKGSQKAQQGSHGEKRKGEKRAQPAALVKEAREEDRASGSKQPEQRPTHSPSHRPQLPVKLEPEQPSAEAAASLHYRNTVVQPGSGSSHLQQPQQGPKPAGALPGVQLLPCSPMEQQLLVNFEEQLEQQLEQEIEEQLDELEGKLPTWTPGVPPPKAPSHSNSASAFNVPNLQSPAHGAASSGVPITGLAAEPGMVRDLPARHHMLVELMQDSSLQQQLHPELAQALQPTGAAMRPAPQPLPGAASRPYTPALLPMLAGQALPELPCGSGSGPEADVLLDEWELEVMGLLEDEDLQFERLAAEARNTSAMSIIGPGDTSTVRIPELSAALSLGGNPGPPGGLGTTSNVPPPDMQWQQQHHHQQQRFKSCPQLLLTDHLLQTQLQQPPQQQQQQQQPGRSLQHAVSLVAPGQGEPLVGYVSPDTMLRISLKVFNCTPDQLAPTVRPALESLLQRSELEGFVRPGCTHLTVNARLTKERERELWQAGVRSAAEALLAAAGVESAVLGNDMLVQMHGEVAVVQGRRVLAVVSATHDAALAPSLEAVWPLCFAMTVGGASARPLPLLLCGRNLSGPGTKILARQYGSMLPVQTLSTGVLACSGTEWAQVQVRGAAVGCLEVEVERGACLSVARPLLLLPCAAAAAELRTLEQSSDGISDLDSFLRDLGLVVQYLQRRQLTACGLPQPPYTPGRLSSVAGLAAGLVATAAARRWPALLRLLLPATAAGGRSGQAARAAMDVCCPAGMTLLHVAVASGCTATVQLLGRWGRLVGAGWDVAAGDCEGVTPFHVAGMLPNGRDMLQVLAGLSPKAAALWASLPALDGATPAALAAAASADVCPAVALQQPAGAAASLPKPATTAGDAGSASPAKGPHPLHTKSSNCTPATPVAAALAAARPALEPCTCSPPSPPGTPRFAATRAAGGQLDTVRGAAVAETELQEHAPGSAISTCCSEGLGDQGAWLGKAEGQEQEEASVKACSSRGGRDGALPHKPPAPSSPSCPQLLLLQQQFQARRAAKRKLSVMHLSGIMSDIEVGGGLHPQSPPCPEVVHSLAALLLGDVCLALHPLLALLLATAGLVAALVRCAARRAVQAPVVGL